MPGSQWPVGTRSITLQQVTWNCLGRYITTLRCSLTSRDAGEAELVAFGSVFKNVTLKSGRALDMPPLRGW